MAVRTIRRQPGLSHAPGYFRRLFPAYLTGLTWTLGNSVTILGFVALTPTVLGSEADTGNPHVVTSPHLVAIGVLIRSVSWWAVLTGVIGFARGRLSTGSLCRANLVIGIVLAGYAAVTVARAVQG